MVSNSAGVTFLPFRSACAAAIRPLVSMGASKEQVSANLQAPILIWWGPQMVMLYNDAYRPVVGNKHPKSMGQRGRDCWPEIWHIIGPMLEGVLAGGDATWSENQFLLLQPHSRRALHQAEVELCLKCSWRSGLAGGAREPAGIRHN